MLEMDDVGPQSREETPEILVVKLASPRRAHQVIELVDFAYT